MARIYREDGFSDRVNYACKIISAGMTAWRSFDTCFEMGDGYLVATAVYRRSLKNKKIAENIWKYLGKDYFFSDTFPKTKDIKNLKKASLEYFIVNN